MKRFTQWLKCAIGTSALLIVGCTPLIRPEAASVLATDPTLAASEHAAVQPTPVVTATPQILTGVVKASSLNLRAGPNTRQPILRTLHQGEQVQVIGQLDNCAWLSINTAADERGWLAGRYVTLSAACADIATAKAPALSTVTEVPVVAPLPAAPVGPALKADKPLITTSAGAFILTGVELTDRFPPGCKNPPSIGCDQIIDGYKSVVLWLEPVNGPEPAMNRNIFEASDGAYLMADDGAKVERWGSGFVNQRYMVVFVPSTVTTGFSLFWPGNALLPLSE